jgi:hypothetical protein
MGLNASSLSFREANLPLIQSGSRIDKIHTLVLRAAFFGLMTRGLRIEYPGQSIMCLPEGTGTKRSSEVTLIKNYSRIYWVRPAKRPGGKFTEQARLLA